VSTLVQQSVARIRDTNDEVVGTGFALSRRHVMTCAHVVNEALRRPWATSDRPERAQQITIEFPFSDRAREHFTGHVVEWFPPKEAVGADIAVIELSVDAKVQPLRPAREPVFPGQQFWTIGFPVGQDGGMDAHGQLSRPIEFGRLIAHGDDLPGFFIEGGYSGGPILDGQTAVLLGMAAMAVREKERRTAFILPIQDLERAWPPLARPYKGLAAFRESDARFFKGRDRYVQELANKLKQIQTVAIVGPSGSGKSSLVRAGLLPLLRSQKDWRVIVFRPATPTANPFANLIMALDDRASTAPIVELLAREAKEVQVIAASLFENPQGFGSILRRLGNSDGRPLFLFGDQFEELFTAIDEPIERDTRQTVRARFVQALVAGLREVSNCKCVLTIRADYMGRVLEVPELVSLLRDADVKLGPMVLSELREVITQPAATLGVQIDEELVSEFLVAVGNTPDALPLLEFALTELWSQQHHRRIERTNTSDGSAELVTDMQAPLIRHAESVFEDMAREYGEATFRGVMVGLVWITDTEAGGQDTRRPRNKDSFTSREWELVEQLASEHREARLITVRGGEQDRQVTAEIAHEVLIRQWPRLQRWLNEDRAFRLWLQTTEREAKGWRKAADPDLLYRGGRLQEALRWQRERAASDMAMVTDFIDAAEQQHRDAIVARQRAEEERINALTIRAEAEERARSEAERRAVQERAAAEEATRLQAEANIALRQAEQEKARADSARTEAELQRDAARVAQVATGRALFRSRIALGLATLAFLFSVLAASYAVYQWREGRRLAQLALANESRALSALSRVALSRHYAADSLKLALAALPRNLTDKRPRLETALEAISEALSTERIASREIVHKGVVRGAQLSKDERRILSWSDDKTLRLWDAATGQQIGPDMRHDGLVYGAQLSKDERRILSWSADKTLRLWDAATGQQIGPAMRHDGRVHGAQLSKDEHRILSWSDDNTLRMWDVSWPEGSILEVACGLLPDSDLLKVSRNFGITISDPICQPKDGTVPLNWSPAEQSR
jgi:energy-coupling factor transporter ATP-binding protein EcfA2